MTANIVTHWARDLVKLPEFDAPMYNDADMNAKMAGAARSIRPAGQLWEREAERELPAQDWELALMVAAPDASDYELRPGMRRATPEEWAAERAQARAYDQAVALDDARPFIPEAAELPAGWPAADPTACPVHGTGCAAGADTYEPEPREPERTTEPDPTPECQHQDVRIAEFTGMRAAIDECRLCGRTHTVWTQLGVLA